MITRAVTMLAAALLAACVDEVPPPSVQQLIDDPILLEATVVRCASNRAELRYEPGCVNARQAVSSIEAQEERARREALELQSERKREALRRTQEAAAEARRRAEDAERLRREAEYNAQFGEAPPEETIETGEEPASNAPNVVVPTNPDQVAAPMIDESFSPSDGGNAPTAETATDDSGLDAIREELQRRSAGEPE